VFWLGRGSRSGSCLLRCMHTCSTILAHLLPQVYAVYGGWFILLSYMWGWAVDKERPDTGKGGWGNKHACIVDAHYAVDGVGSGELMGHVSGSCSCVCFIHCRGLGRDSHSDGRCIAGMVLAAKCSNEHLILDALDSFHRFHLNLISDLYTPLYHQHTYMYLQLNIQIRSAAPCQH
jgi:hypothetical protein